MGDLTEEITRDCHGIPLYIDVSRSTSSMLGSSKPACDSVAVARRTTRSVIHSSPRRSFSRIKTASISGGKLRDLVTSFNSGGMLIQMPECAVFELGSLCSSEQNRVT